MPFVTDEVVTAAKLNLATQMAVARDYVNSRTFTNTGYLDLDALTGGAGSLNAVAVTLTTGTVAKVTVSANVSNSTAGALTIVGYRVSGATTLAADNDWAFQYESGQANDAIYASCVSSQIALTAGSNTFELQALVSAGTGTLARPHLVVETYI